MLTSILASVSYFQASVLWGEKKVFWFGLILVVVNLHVQSPEL